MLLCEILNLSTTSTKSSCLASSFFYAESCAIDERILLNLKPRLLRFRPWLRG